MNRDRKIPNIERSFTCSTNRTHHGSSPFRPHKDMPRQARGDFSKTDDSISSE